MILKSLEGLKNAVGVETETALDTEVKPHIRILNGSLDDDGDTIVLNGRVDQSTLRFLRVDQTYQRPLGNRPELVDAIRHGVVVPNIDIAVRSQNFESQGDDYVIHEPAYIIDGWQRVGSALRLLEQEPNHQIRVFATVHFGSDQKWEAHRFTELNKNVRRVSPNLHLRNMRDTNDAVATLYGLSNNQKDFAFYKRICWSQNMHRDELTTAANLLRAARHLHIHIATAAGSSIEHTAEGALRVARKIGLPAYRKNVHTLINLIDQCWGIREIEYRAAAPQIRGGFVITLARLLSNHLDFWDADGKTLFISADHRRRLKSFPIQDPQVRELTRGGASVQTLLMQLLINHMNKGRQKSHHLRSRYTS